MDKSKFVFVLFSLFVLFINLNQAINYKWNSLDTSGLALFSDGNMWNPIGVPNKTDDVTIDNGGIVNINTAEEIKSMQLPMGTILLIYSLTVNETMYIGGLGNLLLAFDSLLLPTNLILDNGLIAISHLYENDGFLMHDGSIGNSNIILKQESLINLDKSSSLFMSNIIMEVNDYSGILVYQNSKFLSEHGTLNFNQYSYMETNGSVVFLHSFNANNKSELIFRSSNVTVFSDSSLNNYSKMLMFSNIYLSTGLVMNDNSSMYIYDDSRVLLAGNMFLNDNSTLVCQGLNSSVFILDTYIASDTSLFISNGCGLTVVGRASFQVTYVKDGIFLISNVAILKNETPTFSSFIAINGTLIVEKTALFSLVDSTVVSIGDFNIDGKVEGYNSYIQINKGNLNLFENGIFLMDSCNVTLRNGIVQAQIGSYIQLVNTSLSILNGGTVQSQGDFFIDENSGVNNIGKIDIYSNIYFKNDSSLKTNSVSVLNDMGGEFNVESSISVNVALVNSGSINLKNNSLFIYEFNQNNGGNFKLNGGSLNSDHIIKINGGVLSGSGIINQSIIHTNGEFGSNLTSSLNITGDYSSTINSKIIITVNTLNEFSNINIANNADVQGLIEIRINENLLTKLFPNLFKSLDNNQLNAYSNLLNSASPSTSSSSLDSNRNESLNIINFNSKSNSSFGNIVFKSFSPNSGKENEIESKCISSKSSSSSLSLLFSTDNECSGNGGSGDSGDSGSKNKKLSTGAIVGIVIACVFVTVLVISIVHYRERIRLASKRFGFIQKVRNIKLQNK